MRILFLILLSACYVPSGNNGNGNNRRNQADTSSSTSDTECIHVTDPGSGLAVHCGPDGEIVYICATNRDCWYEAGNLREDIADCSDQRSVDKAQTNLADDCGGFYTN